VATVEVAVVAVVLTVPITGAAAEIAVSTTVGGALGGTGSLPPWGGVLPPPGVDVEPPGVDVEPPGKVEAALGSIGRGAD